MSSATTQPVEDRMTPSPGRYLMVPLVRPAWTCR
jgi:hypothetical protein